MQKLVRSPAPEKAHSQRSHSNNAVRNAEVPLQSLGPGTVHLRVFLAVATSYLADLTEGTSDLKMRPDLPWHLCVLDLKNSCDFL